MCNLLMLIVIVYYINNIIVEQNTERVLISASTHLACMHNRDDTSVESTIWLGVFDIVNMRSYTSFSRTEDLLWSTITYGDRLIRVDQVEFALQP